MELLSEIRKMIDLIGTKPDKVKLSEVRSVLSSSHELVRESLGHAQKAEQYSRLYRNYEEIEKHLQEQQEQNAKLEKALSEAQANLEALEKIRESVCRELTGKVLLVQRYSEERKKELTHRLCGAGGAELAGLQEEIRSDFNAEWGGEEDRVGTKRAVPLENFENFKPGV